MQNGPEIRVLCRHTLVDSAESIKSVKICHDHNLREKENGLVKLNPEVMPTTQELEITLSESEGTIDPLTEVTI